MDKIQMIISICFGIGSLMSLGVAIYCTVIIIQQHMDKRKLDKKYGKEEILRG